MSFNPERCGPIIPESYEELTDGSRVKFKKRERSPLSGKESEFKLENEEKIAEGIAVLRKIKNQALEEQDPILRQKILREAHDFSSRMAEVILDQACGDKPVPIDSSFLETLEREQINFQGQCANSATAIPSKRSARNIFLMADDILVRIEEIAHSVAKPDHKLKREEMECVIQEFLLGINLLSETARNNFFEKNSRIGGILSGGSVCVELVKKVVARYGDPSLAVNSFVIAVDRQKNKAAFEAGKDDGSARSVFIMDDVIYKGGTLVTALSAAGEHYHGATIYSGKGIDEPGEFYNRRLLLSFQDFANLADKGRYGEALAIFNQAVDWAKIIKTTLPEGWHIIKKRMEESNPM